MTESSRVTLIPSTPSGGGPTSRRKMPATPVILAAGAILITMYTVRYLADPALPGNQTSLPLGWWGWFDQSMTLRSTRALVDGNFDPGEHYYPFGYALLGTLFYFAAPSHTFFLVDLLSLLGAFIGFVALARRLGLAPLLSAPVFGLSLLGNSLLFRQWIVPWSTTPVGGFMWMLLACCASWLDGRRRPFVIGLLMAAVPACRPSDALTVLPCLGALIWADRRTRSGRWADWLRLAAGAALVTTPVVALHLAVHGFAANGYIASSSQVGFTLEDLGWKAYVLLLEPQLWFADGQGLLQRMPWVALGLTGLVAAFVRGQKDRVLATVLLVHGVLYTSYVDLLPSGLWRFLHVHYFAWAVPGYGLMAALLIRDLARPGWPRRIAGASAVAAAVVFGLRVVPAPAAADQPAKAVDFAGPVPPFTDTYLDWSLALQDARGVLRNMVDVRVLVYPSGIRVLALRRGLVGTVEWIPGRSPQGYEGTKPTSRWTMATRFTWPPRWLRTPPPSAIGIPSE